MGLRIRLARGFWTSRLGLAVLGGVLFCVLVGAGTFTYYYVKYARLIDQRLTGGSFQATTRIYSGPARIFVGQAISARDLVGYLQRAGYSDNFLPGSPGQYSFDGSTVDIRPSSDSYFAAAPGKNALRVEFSSRDLRSIHSLANSSALASAEIEPELLTNLFDQSREKRRPVHFEDLPKPLVDAVLSAEDKRFFEHPGFDPLRVLGAAWADLRRERIAQGASTITMQVARNFFFSTERTWRRKLAETLMALEIEQRFSKKQIFELYANEVYLGNRGSFAIHGFGEASQAYFAKDVRELSLGEEAFLAGIIRSPNRYSSSDRKPERAAQARNRVLNQMVENKTISSEDAQAAMKAPLRLVSGGLPSSAAPYFVDMVKDHLLDRFSEPELLSESFRIYTTLDPALQRAAAQAVEIGIQDLDKQLARRYARWRKAGEPPVAAQVAVVVLDPRTGEIKALIGGRDYGQSQLNRALARRQPGSAFKPFVYAAAFDDAVDGQGPIVTPATTVVDEPTTFLFDGKEYTPNNYGEQFHGTVTLREALTRSLNVATVKVAELVGYGRVAAFAKQLGLDPRIQPTPAVALGAYEMTPLDVAGGYTVFANGGVRAEPMFLRRVVSGDGSVLENNQPRTREVLDPRVAYLVTNVMEDVINHGTGYPARARGFNAPAAGKTGTSHDGWFAGFTSNLLCVVWVGFDDNRELGLAGGASAAPIFGEFMKRAAALPAYRDVQEFPIPDGVVALEIDPETQQLATPYCPVKRTEVYLRGTDPTEFCARHGGRQAAESAPGWLSNPAGAGNMPEPPPPGEAVASGGKGPVKPGAPKKAAAAAPAQQATPQPEKKKSFLQKIFGIFGGSKKEPEKTPPKP